MKSIKAKLFKINLLFLLGFLLLSAIMVAVIFLTDSTLRQAVMNQYKNRQKILIQQLAGRIETRIGVLMNQINTMANLPVVQQLAGENQFQALKEIGKLGDEFSGYVLAASRYDQNGSLAYSWPTLRPAGTNIRDEQHAQIKLRSFQVARKRGVIYTSAPPITQKNTPMILTVPIYNLQGFSGVLLFEINWETLKTELLAELDKEHAGDLLLLNKEGFVLYYTQQGIEGSAPFPPDFQFLTPVTEKMVAGEAGNDSYLAGGIAKLVFFNPIMIGNDLWSVAIIEKESNVFAALNPQLNKIYGLLALAIGFIGIMVLLIGRQYNRLQRLNLNLEGRLQDLNAIHQAVKLISGTLDMDKLLKLGVTEIARLVGASKGSIFLLDKARDEMAMRAVYGYDENSIHYSRFKVGEGVAGLVAKEGKAIIVEDVNKDPRFVKTTTNWVGCRSLLCVPLLDEGEIKGILNLQDKNSGTPFNPYEAQLAETVANNVAIAIKNVQLMESMADKIRLEKELETAKAVQENLFPPANPHYRGLDIAGFFEPASECGGDWWGYIQHNGRLLLFIGDVTGHGVPAALITATVRTYCTNLELMKEHLPDHMFSPGQIMKNLNCMLFKATKRQFVMTFFVSEYDPEKHQLTFANAGHNHPWVYRGATGKVELLKAHGLRLGDEQKADFTEESIKLYPEDVVLWYTDGLVEGENGEGVIYGKKRTRSVLAANARGSSLEIQKAIIEDAYKFFGDTPKKDDITLVIGKVSSNGKLDLGN